MPSYPWLSVTYENNKKPSLWIHNSSFHDVSTIEPETQPGLITFIGSHHKSQYLACLIGYAEPLEQHGQIRILRDPCWGIMQPSIFLDCEISSATSSNFQLDQARCASRMVEWARDDQLCSSRFSDHVIHHILTPLSSVICYFAADLQGINGVARSLAYQAVLPRAHNLPPIALPQILIVVETASKAYNVQRAHEKVQDRIVQEMLQIKSYATTEDATRDLAGKFRAIHVAGLQKNTRQKVRTAHLSRKLSCLLEEVHWARRTSRYLFSRRHLDVFSTQLISDFCKQETCFDFIRASRPEQFDERQIKDHIDECLALLPGQNWLWPVMVPLLASAFCLASYPPGSHNFPTDVVFDCFFAAPCKQAISDYTRDVEAQNKFVSSIKSDMEERFRQLDFDSSTQSALTQHLQCLESLWPHLAKLTSFRGCICCFMFKPEKVLECDHAVCNFCIRRFGKKSSEGRHSFEVPACFLCGVQQPRHKTLFRLMPPTAGLRVLCMDGGGVRGVQPLVYLKYLQSELSFFGGSIENMFDYVCGTSAGGLIAIGIFLMHWSPTQCLQRFEELAATIFSNEHEGGKLSWPQSLQRLLRVCVQDHRYSLSPVERAFVSTIGATEKMFNPLQTDTKVAVTSTSVRANTPCVISNYNGGSRSDDHNYFHIRPAKRCHDMSISDAAACTSAAPFFFKSKDIDNLDTFQDGGLRHNCPAFLTGWELGIVWPEKGQIFDSGNCKIDHMLSLGTGTSASSKYAIGPHSPRRERFIQRFVGNYKVHLDSELQWKTFFRCVPPDIRARLYRLNVSLSGTEPALDDITAMEGLKTAAFEYIKSNAQTSVVRNSMIASMFYLEIDSITSLEGGSSLCHGTIFSRIPMEPYDRRDLYQALQKCNAFFVVNGHNSPCVESVPKGMPIFRKSVDFILKGAEDKVEIFVTGITSEPTYISGMPTQLNALVKAQGLEMPFGCIDHRTIARKLPATPLKRKICDV